jgi:hypothetical protein
MPNHPNNSSLHSKLSTRHAELCGAEIGENGFVCDLSGGIKLQGPNANLWKEIFNRWDQKNHRIDQMNSEFSNTSVLLEPIIEESGIKQKHWTFCPELPTLAFVMPAPADIGPLSAVAAAEFLKRGQKAPNIIFLSRFAEGSMELASDSNGKTWLQTRYAGLINSEGKIHLANFQEPVRISMIAGLYGIGEELSAKLASAGISFLTSPDAAKVSNDKRASKDLFRTLGISTPDSIDFQLEKDHDVNWEAIRKMVSKFIMDSKAKEFVLKPCQFSGGVGVEFLPKNPELAAERFISVCKTFGDCILENRVKSYPVRFEGERFDFNARGVVSKHGFIDGLIRASHLDTPGNICRGARCHEINRFERYFITPSFDGELLTSEYIKAELDRIGVLIARAMDSNYVTVDVMFDSQQKSWTLEFDDDHGGAFLELEMLRKGTTQKFESNRRFFDLLESPLLEQHTKVISGSEAVKIEPLALHPLMSSEGLAQYLWHRLIELRFDETKYEVKQIDEFLLVHQEQIERKDLIPTLGYLIQAYTLTSKEYDLAMAVLDRFQINEEEKLEIYGNLFPLYRDLEMTEEAADLSIRALKKGINMHFHTALSALTHGLEFENRELALTAAKYIRESHKDHPMANIMLSRFSELLERLASES